MNNENSNNIEQYYKDEINLRKLGKSLKERIRFIFGFTGIITLLAIAYVLSLSSPPPQQYIVSTSFERPSKSSVMNLNKSGLLNETRLSIYSSFLNNIVKESLQKKVFTEGGYLSRLNKQNELVGDVDKYISGFFNSVSLEKKFKWAVAVDDIPHTFSIQVDKPEIFAEFLNELVVEADNETVSNYISLIKKKIAFRLDEIATERELLLAKAQQYHLALIERIKEEDAQKIRVINDKIDALRIKAQQDRLNQIEILTETAKLASSLGIIENNIKQLSVMTTLKNIPYWYLYGEKVLLARVEILKSRTNDDPFIPELVTLNNQINIIQNNHTLKTLEERENDKWFSWHSVFPELVTLNNQINIIQNNHTLKTLEEREDDNLLISRINELDNEKIKFESIILESSGISSIQLSHSARSQQISYPVNKKRIVALALFGSFMLSIVLALLMNLFKEDETETTIK
jgi:LPS O-antigen subunit length determinant protein (WzzB/FepE family)